jgi:hypothetical protein
MGTAGARPAFGIHAFGRSEWAPVAVAGAVLRAADDVVGGLAASQFAGCLLEFVGLTSWAGRASR